MADPITLTTGLIEAANEFLCGGKCKAKRKAEFFTAADAESPGQTLVDQYDQTPDSRSWLGEVQDGTIGVRVTKSDSSVVERSLWYNGEFWAQTCPAGASIACVLTSKKPNATYDKVRVAAFFAATLGFSGLHPNEPKMDQNNNTVTDRTGKLVLTGKSQMAALREGKRAARVILDEALAKFGQYKGIAVPTSIRIIEELKTALNTFLGFEFIEEKHIGHLLVSQNPEETTQEAKKNSSLTGVDASNKPGTGVIGIVYRGAVTLKGETVADGRIEKTLSHSGEVKQQRCNDTYTTCEFDASPTDPKSSVLKKDVPTANIAMATAALFGFGALYDNQLLKNFEPTGPKEEAQRVALDTAFAKFVKYRKHAASDLPAPAVAKAPEAVVTPPVAVPPASSPVETEAPTAKIPPPTAEASATPPVVAAEPSAPPAPVADAKPAEVPPLPAADDGKNPMEYFADAVERMLEYGRNVIDSFKNYEPPAADAPTVTSEPLLSPAEAVTYGAGAWSAVTGADMGLTAWRIRRAGQPITLRSLSRGVPPRLAAGGGIKGVGLRSVGYGVFAAAVASAAALIGVEQSEALPTVESDERLSDD